MGSLGKVCIGKPAPDFHCDAVIEGKIQKVTLNTYISPARQRWLILLFIPAAFSYVCPTEVLAFENCLDEFHDRRCDIVFISVDTKHVLWHWKNVPRQYGGLGKIKIPLLSDSNHRMSKDYGVLIEEEGVSLRGMFILDEVGIVQQATLNNVTVGRSVLEALRLLEAFQAVAKHGVLCPIDWHPATDTDEMLNTIPNTLPDPSDEHLLRLQKEFGDTLVTDLDAKHKSKDQSPNRPNTLGERLSSDSVAISSSQEGSMRSREGSLRSNQAGSVKSLDDLSHPALGPLDPIPSSPDTFSRINNLPNNSQEVNKKTLSLLKVESTSAPPSASVTPTPTPSAQNPPRQITRINAPSGSVRQSKGYTNGLVPPNLSRHNTYESRRGSHIFLEFADPTLTPKRSPPPPASKLSPISIQSSSPKLLSRTTSMNQSSRGSTPKLETPPPSGKGLMSPIGTGQTRLQATFEAIKKMSSGLASPKLDLSSRKNNGKIETKEEAEAGPGYFDAVS
ncbi:thioredoxin-like protein [Aaosphaeria arxii CBS 175.79]|uniref:Thioredoxin-like protein n=1 Tax=Aaosphaeria arxii CBS 175.79 TaxID=1450172 RepID=A0A6A5XRY5_9PLEO|nr:thioredoxin-like protein [Aaosphaeria arxii CBS 175.79]KAF2015511.1 thioredoxin-like protein [Aaosphaeria arxii CBS 175.79]